MESNIPEHAAEENDVAEIAAADDQDIFRYDGHAGVAVREKAPIHREPQCNTRGHAGRRVSLFTTKPRRSKLFEVRSSCLRGKDRNPLIGFCSLPVPWNSSYSAQCLL